MARNAKGQPPEKAAPPSHSRTSRTESSSNTPPVVDATLAPLKDRLIPLCRPLNGRPGCNHPKHNNGSPCNAPGKRPLERQWANPDHVPHWPNGHSLYNRGVRCGTGLAVLDVDPRNGGTELLAALERAHGRLPATPEVHTGGGGRHLYFEADPEQSSWKLQGVELKAKGSQVVAPGSLHASGEKYDWIAERTPREMEPAPLPPWLSLPPEKKEPLLKSVPHLTEADPRLNVWINNTLTWGGQTYELEDLRERASRYLDSMPESVSGKGGHEVAFRVSVALVRGFLLPDHAARQALVLWNQAKASPKWSKGDLEHKLQEAKEKPRHKHFSWGYLLRGEPVWPELAEPDDKEDDDGEEPDDKVRARTIENRLVYISAHDKFMWFEEGVEKPGLVEWQSYFSENGARAMLQTAGYGFKRASVYVKEKRCHIVKDLAGHVPTNQRIVKGPDGKGYLNLPQHLIPEATPGPTPLLDELMHSIAGGDVEAEEWLWNWAAYVTQFPDDLPGVCVVVRGDEGVGKSKLGQAIGYCRGGYVSVGNSIFREQFNSKWADARFIAAAEVMLADSRKEHTDRFKAWITDPFIEYHKKNVPEFNIPNRIAWWLSSNDDNPIVVPRSDRRFTILESVSPPPDVKALLIKAWSQFDRREHEWPELQAFRHKLLQWKVDRERARRPLLNKVHDEHAEHSKSSVELFTDEVALNGWRPLAAHFGITGMTWDEVPPKHIGVDGSYAYAVYNVWAKAQGLGALGRSRFSASTYFRKAFKQTRQVKIKGMQYRFWILPAGVDPDDENR